MFETSHPVRKEQISINLSVKKNTKKTQSPFEAKFLSLNVCVCVLFSTKICFRCDPSHLKGTVFFRQLLLRCYILAPELPPIIKQPFLDLFLWPEVWEDHHWQWYRVQFFLVLNFINSELVQHSPWGVWNFATVCSEKNAKRHFGETSTLHGRRVLGVAGGTAGRVKTR